MEDKNPMYCPMSFGTSNERECDTNCAWVIKNDSTYCCGMVARYEYLAHEWGHSVNTRPLPSDVKEA